MPETLKVDADNSEKKILTKNGRNFDQQRSHCLSDGNFLWFRRRRD